MTSKLHQKHKCGIRWRPTHTSPPESLDWQHTGHSCRCLSSEETWTAVMFIGVSLNGRFSHRETFETSFGTTIPVRQQQYLLYRLQSDRKRYKWMMQQHLVHILVYVCLFESDLTEGLPEDYQLWFRWRNLGEWERGVIEGHLFIKDQSPRSSGYLSSYCHWLEG